MVIWSFGQNRFQGVKILHYNKLIYYSELNDRVRNENDHFDHDHFDHMFI